MIVCRKTAHASRALTSGCFREETIAFDAWGTYRRKMEKRAVIKEEEEELSSHLSLSSSLSLF